jgi:hypothetical protein
VIRDPRLYLDDILESIDAIAEYTANLDEDAFRDARLVQDAVLSKNRAVRQFKSTSHEPAESEKLLCSTAAITGPTTYC